jgi:hypothetical protein
MKTLLLILFLPFFSFSQEIKLPEKDGKIVYQIIDSVPGTSNDVLYNRIVSWFATEFNNAKNVILVDDRVSGLIIGKANFNLQPGGSSPKWPCNFVMTIKYKDSKYKAVFDTFLCGDGQYPMEPNYEHYKSGKSKKIVTPLITELDQTMRSLQKSLMAKCTAVNEDF